MPLLKKYKKSVLIGIFFLKFLSSYSFKLQNISFNQRMDTPEGGYREFYIKNDYLSKQRYKVNVLASKEKDGSKFVEVYPKVITIDPQSKGTIKVFAKAPQTEDKGEYRFQLQFQPINIPTLSKNKDGKITGTSNINIAPVIEVKSYIGEIDFKEALRFENINVLKNSKEKGIIVTGNLSNDSYAGIDFGAEAYGSNEFLYGSSYVGDLAGNLKNRKIQLSFPMIKDIKDLKKIIFYRTPSNIREVLKEIKIEQ